VSTHLSCGKARAIGVSNYCPSCFGCLEGTEVFPHVNQVMYHLSSGTNKDAQAPPRAPPHTHTAVPPRTPASRTLSDTRPVSLRAAHTRPACFRGTAAQDLLAYHKAHGVQTQAYSALGNTPTTHKPSNDILHGPLTTKIAAAHNKSTVQVALKWIVQSGIPAVTKSSNPAHLASDLDLWSWDLTADEMDQLNNHPKVDSPTYPSYACSK
jgi:diketogulonate reductase-like aldo/keto reductase